MTPEDAVLKHGPVPLDLVGQDGNSFALLGAFRRAARRVGWSAEAITAVCDEAIRGNRDHLLSTLMDATVAPED